MSNDIECTEINGVDYYLEMLQGTPEWDDIRRGRLTASGLSGCLTPKLKIATNATTKTYIYDLAAQRIINFSEPHYMGFEMERGHIEEVLARDKYSKEYSDVKECGFIINKELGFEFGYSPDGLVGEDGLIEVKSRIAKHQIKTIVEHMADSQETPIPSEFMIQVQSGLFITKRRWCDFISYSNGLNMAVTRCFPIDEYQSAIADAARHAENEIVAIELAVRNQMKNNQNIFPVEWIDHSGEISV